MAQSRKIIKLRIRSIKNTRKITKAMELVAASKMRRAVANALRARPYANDAWAAVRAILAAAPSDTRQALLQENPKATKTLIVLFSSDRGLAGGFNVNMIRAALAYTSTIGRENVEIVAVGKRAGDALERAGMKVIARFPSLTNNPAYTDLLPVARLALDEFVQGKYKRVVIAATDFISGISQKPRIEELLPLKPEAHKEGEKLPSDVTFEPSPREVFERMLPAIARTMFWQALLESAASEHAARMVAMKSASDAAKDMLEGLTFTYNQIRQGSITQEIAEISGGKAALE